MLTETDRVPKGFLDSPSEDLHKILKGPTLIHLRGRRENPLFVSTLLHGNEDVGVAATQSLLKKYADKELPRSISIFVGNVQAARYSVRSLDGQPDYNRIWKNHAGPEGDMARRVMDIMREKKPFAAVDAHNNTGLNPHYTCVTRLDKRYVNLAAMFDRRVVHFTKPDTTLTYSFSDICPTVTIECGLPKQSHGAEHAADFLDGCLHMSDFPEAEPHEHDIELYHSVAIVKPAEDASFGFCPGDVDICFRDDLDHLNFRLLPPGTPIATVKDGRPDLLRAMDENGEDVGASYFTIRDGEVRLTREIMPSMLTLNLKVIRQDCLCYLMERVDYAPHATLPADGASAGNGATA